jgi:hypothetical protein
MPEGPSIVLLNEALQPFVDKQIINADGSSQKSRLWRASRRQSPGFKHLGKTSLSMLLRFHQLIFGSHSIDTPNKTEFQSLISFLRDPDSYRRSLHFYIGLSQNALSRYDTADIVNLNWNSKANVLFLNRSEVVVLLVVDPHGSL